MRSAARRCTPPQALAGTLQLMVGGDAAALERARPVLAALGGDPNIPTVHRRKDLHLVLQTARRLGLETAGLDGLAALLERTTTAGLDDLDYSALHRLKAGM